MFSIEGDIKNGVTVRLPVAPRTKKTHNQTVIRNGRAIVLPSKQYQAFEREAMTYAVLIRSNLRLLGIQTPIKGTVIVSPTFIYDRTQGDENGYMQALGDWLQKAGIVENDRDIHWHNTQREKNSTSPAIVFTINIQGESA